MMAQEEKARRYDEVLEQAKSWYVDAQIDFKKSLEALLPELKESEDERIKKELIEHFRWNAQILSDFNNKDVIAWLEKQGEHKKFRDSIQVGDEVTRNSDGVIVNLSQLKRVAKPAQQKLPIEKLPEEMKTIGESLGFTTQKECDEYNQMVSGLIMSDEEDYNNIDPHFGKLINKVESKFKAGNWYQCIKDFFGKGVIFDKNTAYYCAKEGCLQNEYGCHIAIVKDLYDNFKLWTIQDAKAGDIIAADPIDTHPSPFVAIYKKQNEEDFDSYCFVGYDGNFYKADNGHSTEDIHPATKEQRDLLFKKMKEAGFEWDSEKKELKKISQRMISAKTKEAMYDKPTDNDMVEALRTEYEKGRADAIAEMQKEWSEDDEKRLQSCINILKAKSLMGKVDTANTMWLKSLKQRIGG